MFPQLKEVAEDPESTEEPIGKATQEECTGPRVEHDLKEMSHNASLGLGSAKSRNKATPVS